MGWEILGPASRGPHKLNIAAVYMRAAPKRIEIVIGMHLCEKLRWTSTSLINMYLGTGDHKGKLRLIAEAKGTYKLARVGKNNEHFVVGRSRFPGVEPTKQSNVLLTHSLNEQEGSLIICLPNWAIPGYKPAEKSKDIEIEAVVSIHTQEELDQKVVPSAPTKEPPLVKETQAPRKPKVVATDIGDLADVFSARKTTKSTPPHPTRPAPSPSIKPANNSNGNDSMRVKPPATFQPDPERDIIEPRLGSSRASSEFLEVATMRRCDTCKVPFKTNLVRQYHCGRCLPPIINKEAQHVRQS